MSAINRALSHMLAQGGSTKERGYELNTESAEIPPLLAQQKYTEACKRYDELAKKFGIDLKKQMEGLVTYEELEKDGGKRGGICGQAEAHAKMMALFQKLQDKVAQGEVDSGVFAQYGEDTQRVEELLFVNPSEHCKKLDEIAKKYGL